MKDFASSHHTGLIILTPLVVIMGGFNICEPEEGRFNVVIRERLPSFILFLAFSKLPSLIFPGETLQSIGVIRTLSRIDRAFVNLPMATSRDFHCFSSFFFFQNLGERSQPSDHAAVRMVIQFKNRLFGAPGQTQSK